MFDAKKQIDVCINFIKAYFLDNGTPNTKAVIGISGGKDSTIAAALLVRALGPNRVIGVMMPEGYQTDIDDSRRVCEILGIRGIEVDIGPACRALYSTLDEGIDYDHTVKNIPQITTNTPSRIRMTTLYAIAAFYGGRVCNTGNASEAFVGYTTKYGDLAGDFTLLRNFTVREIYAMGDAMEELPYDLVHKTPADGMSGKTDEDNMGISYDVIDDHLLYGIIPEDAAIWEEMKIRHKRNFHKMDTIRLQAPHRVDGWLHNKVWDTN
jgi:NAD+ synthase